MKVLEGFMGTDLKEHKRLLVLFVVVSRISAPSTKGSEILATRAMGNRRAVDHFHHALVRIPNRKEELYWMKFEFGMTE